MSGRFNFRVKDGELYGVEYIENRNCFVYKLTSLSPTMVFKNEAFQKLAQLRDNLSPLMEELISGRIIVVRR